MAKNSAAGGYWTSALVFAAITALWVYVVRQDPYYRFIDLFGVRLPAATIAYLVTMPALGFFIGRWRFADASRNKAMPFGAKTLARMVRFLYSHSLLALFTLAMATDYFLGLNIDDQVRQLDDRLFDLAARFAPWLSSYLFGFNLGRATVSGAVTAGSDEGVMHSFETRSEPVFGDGPAPDAEEDQIAGDDARRQSASGVPMDASADDQPADEPGFLPAQDLTRLRPQFNNLR
ncbi:MAG: hypothetical protein R3C60_09990 [Parvularculaceae bacterium]